MGRFALLLMFAAAPDAGDAAFSGLNNAEVAQRAEQEFRRGVELRSDRDKAMGRRSVGPAPGT